MTTEQRTERVLVTGANGFAGAHLTRALLRQGYTVRVFVRRPEALAVDIRAQAEIAVGDLRDRRAVEGSVADCQVVYHQAGLYRDASGPARAYWDVNVTGTEHVLAACARHSVKRLVHCSTVGVHGHVSQIPSDEASPFNPGDAYQRSKLAGEERVWAWYRKTGIPTSVVRPAGIYGPGDLRFLKLFRGIQHGYFVMLGRGETRFHNVYVEDLVDGYLRCATRPEAIGESFLIVGPRWVTLNELVVSIAQVLGVPPPRWRAPMWPVKVAATVCEAVCVPLGLNPPLHRRRVSFFTHDRAFTYAKAQHLLGYAPAVDLLEGLRRTAAWYVQEGFLQPTNGWQKAHVP